MKQSYQFDQSMFGESTNPASTIKVILQTLAPMMLLLLPQLLDLGRPGASHWSRGGPAADDGA